MARRGKTYYGLWLGSLHATRWLGKLSAVPERSSAVTNAPATHFVDYARRGSQVRSNVAPLDDEAKYPRLDRQIGTCEIANPAAL